MKKEAKQEVVESYWAKEPRSADDVLVMSWEDRRKERAAELVGLSDEDKKFIEIMDSREERYNKYVKYRTVSVEEQIARENFHRENMFCAFVTNRLFSVPCSKDTIDEYKNVPLEVVFKRFIEDFGDDVEGPLRETEALKKSVLKKWHVLGNIALFEKLAREYADKKKNQKPDQK